MILSRCVHVVANGSIPPFLGAEKYTRVWVYRLCALLHRRTLWSFPCLGHCEQCCSEHRGAEIFMNKCFQIFQENPRKGGSGSCGSSRFLRTLYTVFHGGCPGLHSHRRVQGFLFLNNLQHLLPLVSLITAVLTGVKMIFHCDSNLHFL